MIRSAHFHEAFALESAPQEEKTEGVAKGMGCGVVGDTSKMFGLDQAAFQREGYCLEAAVDPHLPEEVADVVACRGRANAELRGNRLG